MPHAIAVTTGEVTDRSGVLQAIDRCRPNLKRVENVLVDGGYTGQPFANGVKEQFDESRRAGSLKKAAWRFESPLCFTPTRYSASVNSPDD